MYFSRPLHAWAALTPTGVLSVKIPVYAARTAHDAGFRVIGIADAASKSDEPALREVSDQFLTDWTELDWNKI